MTTEDEEILRKINLDIGLEEGAGQWRELAARLAEQPLRMGGAAPVLAFRRASGDCVDARSFLDAVAKGKPRTVEITSIALEGQCRAIVRCVVEMDGNRFDNLRLFVRRSQDSHDWRLLAWANEPIG